MGHKIVMAGGGDYGDAVSKFWPLVAGFAVAIWTITRSWFARHDLSEKAKTTLVAIAQKAAGDVIKMQSDQISIQSNQITAQAKRIDQLESEFDGLQKKHSEMMASKDAEITLLRGECREAMTLAMSYERLLTENKVPHEQPIRPFWDVSGNELRAVRV